MTGDGVLLSEPSPQGLGGRGVLVELAGGRWGILAGGRAGTIRGVSGLGVVYCGGGVLDGGVLRGVGWGGRVEGDGVRGVGGFDRRGDWEGRGGRRAAGLSGECCGGGWGAEYGWGGGGSGSGVCGSVGEEDRRSGGSEVAFLSVGGDGGGGGKGVGNLSVRWDWLFVCGGAWVPGGSFLAWGRRGGGPGGGRGWSLGGLRLGYIVAFASVSVELWYVTVVGAGLLCVLFLLLCGALAVSLVAGMTRRWGYASVWEGFRCGSGRFEMGVGTRGVLFLEGIVVLGVVRRIGSFFGVGMWGWVEFEVLFWGGRHVVLASERCVFRGIGLWGEEAWARVARAEGVGGGDGGWCGVRLSVLAQDLGADGERGGLGGIVGWWMPWSGIGRWMGRVDRGWCGFFVGWWWRCVGGEGGWGGWGIYVDGLVAWGLCRVGRVGLGGRRVDGHGARGCGREVWGGVLGWGGGGMLGVRAGGFWAWRGDRGVECAWGVGGGVESSRCRWHGGRVVEAGGEVVSVCAWVGGIGGGLVWLAESGAMGRLGIYVGLSGVVVAGVRLGGVGLRVGLGGRGCEGRDGRGIPCQVLGICGGGGEGVVVGGVWLVECGETFGDGAYSALLYCEIFEDSVVVAKFNFCGGWWGGGFCIRGYGGGWRWWGVGEGVGMQKGRGGWFCVGVFWGRVWVWVSVWIVVVVVSVRVVGVRWGPDVALCELWGWGFVGDGFGVFLRLGCCASWCELCCGDDSECGEVGEVGGAGSWEGVYSGVSPCLLGGVELLGGCDCVCAVVMGGVWAGVLSVAVIHLFVWEVCVLFVDGLCVWVIGCGCCCFCGLPFVMVVCMGGFGMGYAVVACIDWAVVCEGGGCCLAAGDGCVSLFCGWVRLLQVIVFALVFVGGSGVRVGCLFVVGGGGQVGDLCGRGMSGEGAGVGGMDSLGSLVAGVGLGWRLGCGHPGGGLGGNLGWGGLVVWGGWGGLLLGEGGVI
ncbi:hypothetical protein Tco_0590968 [Tanacetum coccineum]